MIHRIRKGGISRCGVPPSLLSWAPPSAGSPPGGAGPAVFPKCLTKGGMDATSGSPCGVRGGREREHTPSLSGDWYDEDVRHIQSSEKGAVSHEC